MTFRQKTEKNMNDTTKNDSLRDLGILMIRLILAAVFLYHGSQKLFGMFGGYGISGTAGFFEKNLGIPFPYLSAIMAALAEFVGGLSLLTGIYLRWAMVPLSITMLVAAFSAHTGFGSQTGGMEYPLTLAISAAGLGLIGAGRFAIQIPKRG